ncbi:MAG: hypothetical protein V1702_03225 [Candidatus Woesearchaeota archaeon]
MGQGIVVALVNVWNSFALALPGVFWALVVLLIGYIVGAAVGFLIHKILDKAQVDAHIRRAGFAHSIGFISVPAFTGGIVKWFIFSLFLWQAALLLQFSAISEFIRMFAVWVPNLIAAIVMVLLGLVLADFLADRMLHAKRKGIRLASGIVRWFVIIFIAVMALQQIGIDVSLLTNTTLILVAGAALGLGIALGLGFGNAIKDEAKGIIKSVKKGF